MYGTYKDYSTVPPSMEEIRLHKRKEDIKKVLSNHASDQFDKMVLSDPAISKRGRGNRMTLCDDNIQNSATGVRFIGLMGTNFPARLHDLLTQSEEHKDNLSSDRIDETKDGSENTEGDNGGSKNNNIASVISWLPHGRSWMVHDKEKFIKTVSPSHFHFTKYESFIRQVNAWGFKRTSSDAKDSNSFYHEKFLRGMPHLVGLIKRNSCALASKHNNRKQHNGTESYSDLDFYAMDSINPIPDYYSNGAILLSEEVSSSPNKDISPLSASSSASTLKNSNPLTPSQKILERNQLAPKTDGCVEKITGYERFNKYPCNQAKDQEKSLSGDGLSPIQKASELLCNATAVVSQAPPSKRAKYEYSPVEEETAASKAEAHIALTKEQNKTTSSTDPVFVFGAPTSTSQHENTIFCTSEIPTNICFGRSGALTGGKETEEFQINDDVSLFEAEEEEEVPWLFPSVSSILSFNPIQEGHQTLGSPYTKVEKDDNDDVFMKFLHHLFDDENNALLE